MHYFRQVPNNISTVSLAENELTGSFPNCLPQFTLQGSDFPRLGKSASFSKASNSLSSSQDRKSVAKPQKVTAASSAKAVSYPNEVSPYCKHII